MLMHSAQNNIWRTMYCSWSEFPDSQLMCRCNYCDEYKSMDKVMIIKVANSFIPYLFKVLITHAEIHETCSNLTFSYF